MSTPVCPCVWLYYQTVLPPVHHHTTHEDGGADEISVAGLTGLLATAQTPVTHHTTHEDGGTDELSVAGLSGLLATAQTPVTHHTTHESGGTDAIKLDDLAAPDNNTDLDASSTKHGLAPKGDGVATNFLNGNLAWATPATSITYSSAADDTETTRATSVYLQKVTLTLSAGTYLLYYSWEGRNLNGIDFAQYRVYNVTDSSEIHFSSEYPVPEYVLVGGCKVLTIAASKQINIQFRSKTGSDTAYCRRARLIAVKVA